jgi:hypothetical protein
MAPAATAKKKPDFDPRKFLAIIGQGQKSRGHFQETNNLCVGRCG